MAPGPPRHDVRPRGYGDDVSGTDEVLDWLVASDPAISWQALRDIAKAPAARWRAERRRVEFEGWGAQLLALEDDDGQWAGGAFLPRDFDSDEWERVGQPWTATTYALSDLREFGVDPRSARVQRAVALIGQSARWDHAGQPFWEGEVEECINGRTVADGSYFGVDMSPLVERLLGERLPDGGWNCERANGSVRSSFASTINVLEGLLAYERAGGDAPRVREARRAAEEFLLERHLFRRLRTGEIADDSFARLTHPSRWRYDVLRALDYFRDANETRDARLGEAILHVRSRRQSDGRWLLEERAPGRVWFHVDDGVGQPSRWITLRARRVLAWWDQPGNPAAAAT